MIMVLGKGWMGYGISLWRSRDVLTGTTANCNRTTATRCGCQSTGIGTSFLEIVAYGFVLMGNEQDEVAKKDEIVLEQIIYKKIIYPTSAPLSRIVEFYIYENSSFKFTNETTIFPFKILLSCSVRAIDQRDTQA